MRVLQCSIMTNACNKTNIDTGINFPDTLYQCVKKKMPQTIYIAQSNQFGSPNHFLVLYGKIKTSRLLKATLTILNIPIPQIFL